MTTGDPHAILRELEDDVSQRSERASRFHRAAAAFEQAGQSESAEHARTEARAFELSGRDSGGEFPGYFQPKSAIAGGATDPPRDFFTPERLDYLAHRACASSNPIHSARFADVAWDLATRKDPEMGRLAAEKYLECARIYKSNLWDQEFEQAVARTANLASMMRDERLIPMVESKLLSYLRNLSSSQDYEPCLDIAKAFAGASHIRLGEQQLREVLSVLTDASYYYRESHPKRDGTLGTVSGPDEFLVRMIEETKLEIGQRAGLVDRSVVQLEMARSFERQGERRSEDSSLAARSLYYRAYEILRNLDATQAGEDLARIRVKLSPADGGLEQEGTELTFEASIEHSTLEEDTRDLFTETLPGTLLQIAGAQSLVPSLEDARSGVEERRRQTPLLSSITHLRFAGGYLTNRVSEPDEIAEKLLADEIVMWVEIFKVVRHYIFERLRSEYDLDAPSLTAYFRRHDAFSDDNVALLERGFASYFLGDYVAALHVLVPRFESMVRDILGHANLPVADPASGGAFTLGTLLANDEFKGAAGSDLIAYYEYVLLKPDTGLNLRNSASHGILELDRMDRGNTELVLHLLLTLTRFYRDPVESEEEQDA